MADSNQTIVLTVSADGDAQFTVDVDGQQVGGIFDATAAHGAGTTPTATQDITLTGDFGSTGPGSVAVNFLNQETADLYIESIDVNGNVIQGNQAVMNPTSVNPTADPNAAVMFSDGTATFNTSGSAPSGGGTSANDTPPVTTAMFSSDMVFSGQAAAVSQLFSASDSDGDTIAQYQVYLADSATGGQPSGSLSQNGNAIASQQNVNITSLAGLTFTGGATAGTDALWLRANDGTQWGNWALVQMNDDPNQTAGSGSSGGSQSSAAQSSIILTVSADGDAQFTVDVDGQQVGGIFDATAAHGTGTTAAATQDITLTGDFGSTGPSSVAVNFLNQATADLYIESVDVNGTVIQGNQAVMNPASVNPAADPNAAVMFSDGTATFNTSGDAPSGGGGGTSANDTPPVTTAMFSSDMVFSGQAAAVSQLFSASDPDGDTIAQYQVYLADSATGGQPSGSLSQNGNAIASQQNVNITSLAGLTFTGGATAGTDALWLRANDGTQWGNWALVQMNDDPNNPAPVTTSLVNSNSVASGQTVGLSQLFSASDSDGDTIAQYQVYLADGATGGQPSGSLSQNGNAIASQQNVNVTSLDGLTYTGGATAGTDALWLRANDGMSWGNWTLVQMDDTGGGGVGGGSAGQSSIVLTVSADGDAQFTVDVDGQQVGSIYDATAAHGAGTTAAATQDITLTGDFGATGPSSVAVNFLNQATADLYIESIDVNGNVIQGNQAAMNPASVNPGADPNAAVMFEDGTATFNTSGSPPPSQALMVNAMAGTSSGSGGSSSGGQTTDQNNQTTLIANAH